MSAHHILGPSSLGRRAKCPGSLHVESVLPEPPATEVSSRGTRIHEAAAALIMDAAAARPDNMTDEEWEAARKCVDHALPYTGDASYRVQVETSLRFELMGELVYFGSADLLAINEDAKAGILVDWKTGGKPVDDAECNWQGVGYALAAMQMYDLREVRVEFYNPGPLCQQFTSHTWTASDNLTGAVMGVRKACLAPDAPCIMGEQCRYCRGAYWGTCPAIAGTRAASAFNALQGVTAPDPYASLTDADIVRSYEESQIIAESVTAYRGELIRRAKTNDGCAGYTVGSQAAPVVIPDPLLMCSDLGLAPADVLATCKVTASPIIEMLDSRIEAPTKKERTAQAKALLEPYVIHPASREVLKKGRE